MKRILIAATFLPTMAFAQAAPQPPVIQALQQTVLKLTGEALDWQTKAIEQQATIDSLTKQLADAKVAKPAELEKPK